MATTNFCIFVCDAGLRFRQGPEFFFLLSPKATLRKHFTFDLSEAHDVLSGSLGLVLCIFGVPDAVYPVFCFVDSYLWDLFLFPLLLYSGDYWTF